MRDRVSYRPMWPSIGMPLAHGAALVEPGAHGDGQPVGRPRRAGPLDPGPVDGAGRDNDDRQRVAGAIPGLIADGQPARVGRPRRRVLQIASDELAKRPGGEVDCEQPVTPGLAGGGRGVPADEPDPATVGRNPPDPGVTTFGEPRGPRGLRAGPPCGPWRAEQQGHRRHGSEHQLGHRSGASCDRDLSTRPEDAGATTAGQGAMPAHPRPDPVRSGPGDWRRQPMAGIFATLRAAD